MSTIVDIELLLADLRIGVRYAARAGVLKSREVLDAIENAEAAIARSELPDSFALSIALSDIANAIAPVTIADLHCDRDPFLPESQRKASLMQVALTAVALIVLVMIGYFMHALQREQDALNAIDSIRAMHPQQKLTDLRRLAQWDEPLSLPRAPRLLTDQYYQKLIELTQIYNAMLNTYTAAVSAKDITFFPFQNIFKNQYSDKETDAQGPAVIIKPAPLNSSPKTNVTRGESNADPGIDTTFKNIPITNNQKMAANDPCQEEITGELKLPDEMRIYPTWMKAALRESHSDDCFQLNVLSPGGSGAMFKDTLSRLSFANGIKDKIALRVFWFLPFFYGLLGATVFVMRNIANVRTPAVKWYTVAMRIFLGGVAGIVVGWFSSSSSTNIVATQVLSVPFALAFLTGYGIDVLFNMLDRINIGLAETTRRPHST